jgi:hypothetical protein
MMLSLYTAVKDGLYFDFHVVEMLKHHLPLADEIIVNEGFSRDGTYEAICNLDPKIKVHRFHWDRSDPATWHVKFKNQARRLCQGDWCILLDCDEFIPEWEFDRLRRYLSCADRVIARVKFTHFYGNYKVRLQSKGPPSACRIHRNREDVEVYGDGSDVRLASRDAGAVDPEAWFEDHHFGEVRRPARLRHKWRIQGRQHGAKPRWSRMPAVLFNLFPYDWFDKDYLGHLGIYPGPYIRAVRDNPREFVRDDFKLYDYLLRQAPQ